MKTVLISDLHGCLEEFNELLDLIKYNKTEHRLIIIGDLVDRGPYSFETVQKVKNLNVEVVTGNHDNKAVRWRKHYDSLGTGQTHPMKKVKYNDYSHYLRLNNEEIDWLKNLPAKINIKDNYWAIHAGCVPGIAFDQQKFDTLIRVRYVDKNGKMLALPKNKKQPDNSYFWAELWDQPYNIIYGHHVHETPRIDRNKNNICIGIDTGSCFGGSLTAYFLEDNQFFSVKAKKTYYRSDIDHE